MEAENVPVNKLDLKLSKSAVKISALGQIKSQLSTLKSALIDLQAPANFSKQSAKFSNASIASADITATASSGSYQIEVSSLAKPTIWNLSGFDNASDVWGWYNKTPDQIELVTQTNASVFQDISGKYVLSLTAKGTGTTGAFNLDSYTLPDNVTKDPYQVAEDAEFSINGIDLTRSNNTVSDALTGITLNLTATTVANTPTALTVSNDPVSARPKLEAMVKAYNDLYSLYKSQTASSMDASTRGILNSDFGVSSMMRQITSGILLPLTNMLGDPFDSGQTDLSAMGLNLSENGTLALDETLFAAASSTLQTRLSAGIRIGFSSSADLSSQIGDMLLSGGLIQDRIDSEKSTQSNLSKRRTDLQEKLVGVQARYTAQYASLDALLFKLQGTSDSLKSALDGLTNSQKNN